MCSWWMSWTCVTVYVQLVDELVALLKTGCSTDLPDYLQLSRVFSAVYDVLYAYTKGDSRKNELYFAEHYMFFQEQLFMPVKRTTIIFLLNNICSYLFFLFEF